MKLQIVSDLHLEFSPFWIENAGADALVLSGDICLVDYLYRSADSPYAEKAHMFRAFFEHVSKEFELVFYVLGNHEHYRGDFDTTANKLRCFLPENVILLDHEHFDWQGFRFIGGTLWTNFNNGDPIAKMTVENGLNDYHLIKRVHRKLRAYDTERAHVEFKNYIDENLTDNTIVLGHHAPSFNSITEEYRASFYMNTGYASSLEEFILDRPQIKLWTHGHVHSSHDYMIGNTRIAANPRGYHKAPETKPENPNFDPAKVFEI